MAESYFFCGIGGSGMMPLAQIVAARGAQVAGSDRALDQGRGDGKFDWLRARGVALFPQDGSGVSDGRQIVVASTAIEADVPDLVAAERLGCARLSRAQLLARLFNAATGSVAVGGTSGKSTVTAMTGWILTCAGLDPTIINGAVMANFADADAPFASARVGAGSAFVAEVDESDGSIALYRPHIALVTNVALDHKPMEELRVLFGDFVAAADVAVLNADQAESAALASRAARPITYGFAAGADLHGADLVEGPASVRFTVRSGESASLELNLRVPGRHNASNALAALAAARVLGVPLAVGVTALESFAGIRRRLEVAGSAGGVTVIDDFAHNPDKITASLTTMRAFPGRLLVLFQPHGYGPLKLMGAALVDAFAGVLGPDDVLVLSDPAYFGGSTDRSVGSAEIVSALTARGVAARHIGDRAAAADYLLSIARPGDRMMVMGARDDSLSVLARELVTRLEP